MVVAVDLDEDDGWRKITDANLHIYHFLRQGPALLRGGAQHQNRPASMFDVSSRPSPSPTDGPSASATSNNADDVSFDAGRSCPQMAAALTIQRHFRGLLGRRRYAGRLWEVYAEEEEKQRAERERDLVEETEILVQARKALIDMEELETVRNRRGIEGCVRGRPLFLMTRGGFVAY